MSTRVFEDAKTYTSWDDHFYHPAALRFYDEAIAAMLGMLSLRPGDAVVDAGCGVGVHSVRAVRHGYRVHAVDVSPTALALAQRRASEAAADRVTFVRGDLTALAFRDASVGAMFSWGVIIHIPEIERALDELVRVLKPGGRLALYVTNGACADDALRAVARSLVRRHRPQTRARLGTGAWYAMDDEQIWIWQLDVPALTAYLEERGLRCLDRLAGELTQLHIHLPRAVRPLFHRANNAWFKLRRRLPAWPTAMNLLVFEKRPA